VQLLNGSGVIVAEAAFSAWITDGVRINWTTATTGRYLTVVLFYGTDLSARVDTVALSTQDTDVTYSSMGFKFDGMICGTNGTTFSDASGVTLIANSFGLVSRASNDAITQRALGIFEDNAVADGQVAGKLLTDACATQQVAASETWKAQVSAPTSSGFTITSRTGASSSDVVGFLAFSLGGKGLIWLGTVTTPTVTGNASVTSPGFSLQNHGCVLQILTAYTVEDTRKTDGEAGVVGFSAFTSDVEYSQATAAEDASATTDTQSLSDDVAVNMPAHDGAALVVASRTSMDATGWTLNYTTAPATARKFLAMAIATLPPIPFLKASPGQAARLRR